MEIIAHRGAHRGERTHLPEHTLVAYEQAVKEGADGVECDIRLTKDNVLVCVHDADFVRVAGDKRRVSQLRWDEMKEINLGTSDTPVPVLRFEELLEFTQAHGLKFFIETKHPIVQGARLEHALHEMLVAKGLADNPDIHLISFSARSLQTMKRLNPHMHRVFLRRPAWVPFETPLWLTGIAQGYGPDIRDARLKPWIGLKGDSLYMWTANSAGDVRWAARHGVDWLATDRPADARLWLNEK